MIYYTCKKRYCHLGGLNTVAWQIRRARDMIRLLFCRRYSRMIRIGGNFQFKWRLV